MEKNKMKVRINGMDYILVSAESDEYIQKVALIVDKKMGEITQANPRLSTAMSAVLSAVNLADQYLVSEEDNNALRKKISEYTGELKKLKDELEECKLELEINRETLHDLQIEIAKKDTELSGLKDK